MFKAAITPNKTPIEIAIKIASSQCNETGKPSLIKSLPFDFYI